MPQYVFDKIVAVKNGGEWIGVADVDEARHMLQHGWPVDAGPSHRRALTACEACPGENGSVAAARAAFTVAAMEAGLAFEVLDDRMAFLEFQVAHATAEDVRSADQAHDEA